MDLTGLLRDWGVPAVVVIGLSLFGGIGFYDAVPFPLWSEAAVTISIEQTAPNTFVIRNDGTTLKAFRVRLSALRATSASLDLCAGGTITTRRRGSPPANSRQLDLAFGDASTQLLTGECAVIRIIPFDAARATATNIRVLGDGVDVTERDCLYAHGMRLAARILFFALLVYTASILFRNLCARRRLKREKEDLRRICQNAQQDPLAKQRVLAAFCRDCHKWTRSNLPATATEQVRCVLTFAPQRMLELAATGTYRRADLVGEAAEWALALGQFRRGKPA